jgi:hypothetical protein
MGSSARMSVVSAGELGMLVDTVGAAVEKLRGTGKDGMVAEARVRSSELAAAEEQMLRLFDVEYAGGETVGELCATLEQVRAMVCAEAGDPPRCNVT